MRIYAKWTGDAVYCFSIKCDCANCKIKDYFETPCKMRRTVEYTLTTIGEPPQEMIEERPKVFLSKDELTNALLLESKKDLAKKFNLSLQKMNDIVKLLGINGYVLRMRRDKQKKMAQE